MSNIFLIQYTSKCFIDGLKIDWLQVEKDHVSFSVVGDRGVYTVIDGFDQKFLNILHAINGNINSVESIYMDINN